MQNISRMLKFQIGRLEARSRGDVNKWMDEQKDVKHVRSSGFGLSPELSENGLKVQCVEFSDI